MVQRNVIVKLSLKDQEVVRRGRRARAQTHRDEARGSGPLVNVQVVNNTGAHVRTEEQKNDRGGVDLRVVIDAVEGAMAQRLQRPGTTLNRALGAATSPVKAR